MSYIVPNIPMQSMRFMGETTFVTTDDELLPDIESTEETLLPQMTQLVIYGNHDITIDDCHVW